MTQQLVNIKYRNILPGNEELLIISNTNKFRYQYHTVVAYNKLSLSPVIDDVAHTSDKSFNNLEPFSLYKSGIPITVLKQYMGGKIDKIKLLTAREAFNELRNFAGQCCERISADLCCQIILQEIIDRKVDDLIIFIEKSASDKMLGRLASLQLSLKNVTICFLTYKPSDLMTIAMSNKTSKLRFDINRLMSSNFNDYIGPYPGDSEDSLIQSYFNRPSPRGMGGASFAPMRLDIFSQALRLDQVESKKETIRTIFLNHQESYKDPNDKSSVPRLIPVGYDLLDNHLEKIQGKIKDKVYELRS
jgi:hypothetical protein